MRLGMRELLFLLVLLAMPVASYLFVFQPRSDQLAEARREIRLKQQKLHQLAQATNHGENVKGLGRQIDKLSSAITLFRQKLPAQQEVESVLQQVWKLAARHHLTPKSVRTDKIVKNDRYSELPIKMEIIGNFDGFYSFLLDLEKLKRITHVPTMKLSRLQEHDGSMKADIVLSIFFEGDKPADNAGPHRSHT